MPKLVTKYFDNETLPHIEAGSFKFGTLEEYRAKEANLTSARMMDLLETLIPLSFGSERPNGEIVSMTIGGTQFEDVYLNGPGLIDFAPKFNQWVFCASIGSYDSEHHQSMVNGKEAYLGNPELLNWAEIDMEKFIAAMEYEVSKEIAVLNYSGIVLTHDPVKYNKRTGRRAVRNGIFDSKSFILELAAAFRKPEAFSIEREYRVMARLFAPHQAPIDAKPRYFKSEALRDSIVRVGTLG